jgi:hypothetical protein
MIIVGDKLRMWLVEGDRALRSRFTSCRLTIIGSRMKIQSNEVNKIDYAYCEYDPGIIMNASIKKATYRARGEERRGEARRGEERIFRIPR